MTDYIEIGCQIFPDATLDEVKTALAPFGAITRNGFLCVPKNFDNADLPRVLSLMFGLNNHLIRGLGANQQFFDCLRDNFLCQYLNSRHFSRVLIGTTSGQITIPLAGTWNVSGVWGASSSGGYRPINVAGFIGGEHDENSDIYGGVICQNNVAGGTSYNITSINAAVSDNVSDFYMKIDARRVDC